jgi:hypothetical protein
MSNKNKTRRSRSIKNKIKNENENENENKKENKHISEEQIFNDLHNIINNNNNPFNDSFDDSFDEDEIRNPDESFMDKLVNDDDNNNINEYDDDITKAIKLSRMEYLYHNNSLHNDEHKNIVETYDIDKNIIEESININQDIFDDNVEKEIQLAIELSNKEMEEDFINQEYLIKIESEKIEKEKRIKSIENFNKKIKTLTFTKNDIEIKHFIENVLNDYFELNIDYIIMENDNLYKNLYEIIDSYYKIPMQKNFKKTAITES